jgi:hypothetical protein
MRLSDYPHVIVRVECFLCSKRVGRYRLARLAERFGVDAYLNDVSNVLARDAAKAAVVAQTAREVSAALPGVLCGSQVWRQRRPRRF